ncbi:phospho-N-acetylmuramoyl-pentapeptide-transferase [Pontiella sulfatireligans]|uniref:Phospho-N-acetylmuramoyl-pentapeptide-transferase n=1 Tax=Pontiella sulfatireligans TaxID=2750658 RepID=A0A6C2UHR7_9BACT|nr:phospho-N-acetylmuramoyl-pentapeptide-transferase [Pontiella sulfatireligans]VGO19678.1 Phospho-N-acetylmuramoyl-pentapeptide-transferase [Pontiella sulfatireligans]
MLYYLSALEGLYSPLRLFQYISFRTLGAAATAFIISLVFAPALIRKLRVVNFGELTEDKRVDGLDKKQKVGTPTMGGLLIIIAGTSATLLWAIPVNVYILLTLGTFCLMGGIGFADDFLKIKRRNGLSVKAKFTAQLAWAVIAFAVIWSIPEMQGRVRDLMVPFCKHPLLDLGLIGGFVFLMLVLVGASNAVNLTDGLDGLAIGCSNSVAVAYLLLTYVAGHYNFSEYLQVPFVRGSGELTVFCGALLGAGLGFLWYNCHPAKIFMGDTGSLALGGAIAMLAILIKQELLLVIVGGVFVMEAASVVIQSGWFKYTRKRYGEGRRVFKCAPLHHHFEFVEKERAMDQNRPPELVETVIVTRFWILSIIFALLGIASLKIR